MQRTKMGASVPILRSCMTPSNALAVKLAMEKTPPSAIKCDGVEITVGQNERRCFKPGAGKTESFKDCPTCPEMVVVPAGSFFMGSAASEQGRFNNEGPQHEVTFGRAFAVGRFAITRGEFAAFVRQANHSTGDKCWTFEDNKMEERTGRSFLNPSFAQDDRHPVVCVNWDDARAIAAWVSSKTGKTYRLLSEAEREYVTRAGTTTPFWWGSSITPNQANYAGNFTYAGGGSKGEDRKRTVPVDSFEPNPWGLFDVHGNVFDWTEDCEHDDYQGAPADGTAWAYENCGKRMVRGGSWLNYPQDLRSAFRGTINPNIRGPLQGFRLARTLRP
jgi:formylglycine-generating enzyme required for sulfatase activity